MNVTRRGVYRTTAPAERGVVLAFCLPMLGAMAIIGLASMMSALLEVRMAGNVEYQDRAFESAEFAIEQVIASADFDTTYTVASPKIVPTIGDRIPVPGTASDAYSYRLYLLATDAAPATAGDAIDWRLFHFVVEAAGYSARGSKDLHVQGFDMLRPAGWRSDAACTAAMTGCDEVPYPAPERTYWLQPEAE